MSVRSKRDEQAEQLGPIYSGRVALAAHLPLPASSDDETSEVGVEAGAERACCSAGAQGYYGVRCT